MSDSPAKHATTPPSDIQLEFASSAAGADSNEDMSQSLSATGQESTGGLAAVLYKVRENAAQAFANRKPWAELLDRSAFSKPASVADVTTRIQKNVTHYRTNYFMFFLAIMALTFLTNPSTLLWTSLLLLTWIYLFLVKTTPLVIANREYSDREKLIGMSIISFVVVFFLTSVGATVIYGASLSLAVIALHGAFREPDDLFLDAGGNINLFSNTNANIFAGVTSISHPTGSSMV